MADITGQRGVRDPNEMRLFAPEQLMTEAEQARHPILTGAGEFAGGFTSPEGLMLLTLTGGAGQLTGPGAQTVKQLLAAGFTAQMLTDAALRVPEIAEAIQRGDTYTAQRLATHAVLGAATAGLAGRGMLPERAPVFLREGEVGTPLARDVAAARAARRIEALAANRAPREGMARLAEQERLAEQVPGRGDIFDSVEATAPPEAFPKFRSAARANLALRSERGMTPEDRLATLKENRDYLVSQRDRIAEASPEERAAHERELAAVQQEIAGIEGKPPLERFRERQPREPRIPLEQRFPPSVLEEARQEMRAAADMATSMERPGRYFAGIGQTEQGFIRESPKEGIRHGGSWYGVTSMREFVAGQFPWYGKITEGPETLARLVERGKGAAHDRILERIAEGIERERESARPVVEEYASQLRELAEQVRETDAELAGTLEDLASGRTVGFRDLKGYIEGKIDDAQAATIFSKAVDEAATEAGKPAGAEEPARLGREARPAEGLREEAPGEPARPVEPADIFDTLPGLESAVREQREAAGRETARQLTEEIGRPPESIEAAAGEMERTSPLFRGTEASPQREMFQPGGKGGTYGFRGPQPVLPSAAKISGNRELVTRSEILGNLTKDLGRFSPLPVRVGRFREKALGIYKTFAEAVRLKTALDLPVAFHEVGHHINKLLWGTYQKPSGQIALNWRPLEPFRSELKPPNFGYRPSGRSYLPESFADFVKEYVSDPASAQRKAPRFYEFFETQLARQPELRNVLLDARQQVRRYIEQPAVAKVLAHISKEETPTPKNTFRSLYTYTVDALAPIQRAVRSMAQGERVPTEENAYELARLLAGWWGKADHFLERGTFDANTLQVTGKSLKAILAPWEGHLDDLRAYLVAKRAVEVEARGKKSGIDPADAAETVRQIGTAEMERTAQELYDYSDKTLRYLKSSGMLSDAQYQTIRAANQAYVPFYRVMEESAPGASLAAGGKSLADLWSPVKRMKGSGREIVDPLESIVKNTYTYINLAERNQVARTLVGQARRTEGAAAWMEEVPAPNVPTKFEVGEIRKALIEAGADFAFGPEGTVLLGREGIPLDLETVATIFRPAVRASGGENILTVWENGRRRFYQVQPDLFKALKALDQEQTNILVRILSAPARLLRLGATGLGPEFVIRNPIRDAWTAFLQSRNGFIPGVDSLRGLFHVLKRDDLYWEWKRAGGEHAAMVAMDRTTLQQELKDLLRGSGANAVRHPIETLRMVSEALEAATRVGEFARARRAGTPARAAALESREVTLDFARMGAKTRAVNAIIAFWNAAVQGTDKFVRTHIENPKAAVVKAIAGVTIPSLLLYAVNRDDPAYQELPRWLKDFFWLIPTRGTPLARSTPFVPIPKPFLWGMVYGSVPERVMEWIDKRDPRAFDGLLKNMGEATLPSMVPTAALPLMEAWANRSYYRGTRLEPSYMEQFPASARVLPHTSLFSQKMSQALDRAGIEVSPIKLDNAIFGYTGGLGRDILRTADVLAGRPAGLADLPGIRAFAVRYPSGQMESIRQFYDRLNELEGRFRAQTFSRKYPGAPGTEPFLTQEGRELQRLRSANRFIEDYSQAIRRLQFSDKPPDEKQRVVDGYYLRMAEIAQRALGRQKKRVPLGNPPADLLGRPPAELFGR